MKKSSLSMLKAGTIVTFNWGKDAKGNPIVRTGEFRKMSKEHPNQAVVKWQKDDEDSPSRHWVHFGALHTPEIDAFEAKQEQAEAERKAAEKEQKEQAKKTAKKPAKKNIKKHTGLDKAQALRDLADALEQCKKLGIDPNTLGI